MITFEKTTGQGDDRKTGCVLDYPYFKKYCKIIAIDLSKQQALDADPRAMQQISFTWNLDQRKYNVFHYWRSKRNYFEFVTRICESIRNLFYFNITPM